MHRHWLVGAGVVLALSGVVSCKKTKPAVISVAVSHLKPNGRAWDTDENGLDGKPDIAVCIAYKDGRHCYSGDKPNVSEAVCKDALNCRTKIDAPPSGQVAIEVWDVDAQSDELIAKGKCGYGATCELGGAIVAIADDEKTLAEPKPAKLTECSKAPLDAAKIAALPNNPRSPAPINSHAGQLITIYDYEAPACDGWMLALDNDEPVSWSLKCRRSCVDVKGAGLGALKKLTQDDSDAGAKATWYLVTDGVLKNTVVAVAPLAEGGNEITVATVQAILDEPAYFIAGWLCKNQNAVPGVNPAKCQ